MEVTVEHTVKGERRTDTVDRVGSMVREDNGDLTIYWEHLPEENRSTFIDGTVIRCE